jgi:tRNA 2-selenouridine synthase
VELSRTTPVIDVRSPGEFAQGRISAAVNLPLFDNAERAEIGTLYRQTGRQAALLRGLEIAGVRMRQLAEKGLEIATSGRNFNRTHETRRPDSGPDLLVHCWRGGMRSASVGWLLEQVDLRIAVLDGGYRAWRRAGHDMFARPLRLIVLGGLTGSGKTLQLEKLATAGEQVIDLEALANHRGSAFGNVGLGAQPTVEQFENRLHERMRELDLERRVWIEAESQSIGRNFVPLPFFRQALAAPMIVMNVPLQQRVKLLTDEYSRFPKTELVHSVEKIRKRLGGQNAGLAIEAIAGGEFEKCVEICLAYYDKTYGGPKYTEGRPAILQLNAPDPWSEEVAARLIALADGLLPESGHRGTPAASSLEHI